MKTFSIQPAAEPTGNVFGQNLSALLKGAPEEMRSSVLLQFDIGTMYPELAGTKAVFLELPPVYDYVDLRVLEDNTYEFIAAGPGGLDTVEAFCEEWDAETEDTIKDMYEGDIEFGGAVEVVESENDEPLRITLADEPQWLQSMTTEDHGVDGDWIFLGQLTSGYYFGTVFCFYDPTARIVRNIFECT